MQRIAVRRSPPVNEELSRRVTAKCRALAAVRIAREKEFLPGPVDAGPMECPEMLTMAVPFQPAEPFDVFEEYAFAHNGRAMFVYYNRLSGDIGVTRRCYDRCENDLFGKLMRRDQMILATMSVRQGLDKVRAMVYQTEALTDKTALLALAAITRKKYSYLDFGTVRLMSEHLGDFTCSLKQYLNAAITDVN